MKITALTIAIGLYKQLFLFSLSSKCSNPSLASIDPEIECSRYDRKKKKNYPRLLKQCGAENIASLEQCLLFPNCLTQDSSRSPAG